VQSQEKRGRLVPGQWFIHVGDLKSTDASFAICSHLLALTMSSGPPFAVVVSCLWDIGGVDGANFEAGAKTPVQWGAFAAYSWYN
jgi:hypothetical protein